MQVEYYNPELFFYSYFIRISKHGKLVDMAYMMYSAITGDKSVDGGVREELKVN